ncbi:MAG: putative porin [Paludibacteraceae bacterium]|nr:putative porin [Paludibacteraceae bacterium]
MIRTRAHITLMLLLLAVVPAAGKIKLPKTVIHTWELPRPLNIADSAKVDSSFYNFPMRNEIYDLSICNLYNGNLVSPVMSAIYFNRTNKTDFLFGSQYDIYTPTPQDVRFYNTTTPYSIISYHHGFKTYHEDDQLRFLFTGNITPKWNVGTTLNFTNAIGHYKSQAGKTFNGTVFTSYNGNHYSLQAAFTFNKLSSFENGGLADPSQISDSELKTEDIATNMEGMAGYRYLSGYLNHYYSICVEREKTVHYRERDERGKWVDLDSIKTIYVPVMTFRHVFETSEQTRRYLEKSHQDMYPNCYRNINTTRDSAAMLTIRNTLSATFEEEFNTKLKFGASVFVFHEAQRFLDGRCETLPPFDMGSDYNAFMDIPTRAMADTSYGYTWKNNIFAGGELYKNRGKYIRYGFGGEVCIYGYKIGQFDIYGHLNSGFKLGKDSMTIDAQVDFRNETPNYYLLHYNSNHYRWGYKADYSDEINLKKTYRLHIGGQIAYPTKWVTPRIKVDYENIQKYIYFEHGIATPQQMENGSISLLAIDGEVNLTTPWVNLDNHVIFQYSSNEVIAVPTIALYSNLYYHGTWFKALDAQFGVDIRYNTRYYAPIWNPALAQFCVQDTEKVGNYPTLSVYANFYVRLLHLRFFAQYEHFNTTFMSHEYFSMPAYPNNPGVFKAGLAFHFYK